MQKPDVVEIYKAGRKPKYAAPESEDEDDEYEDEENIEDEELEESIVFKDPPAAPVVPDTEIDDPRLARLNKSTKSALSSHQVRTDYRLKQVEAEEDELEPDDDPDDDVRRRHQLARQVLQAEPYLQDAHEDRKSDLDSDSEDEDSSDGSEQEGPMLKPVFLKKSERTAVDLQKEEEEEIKRQEEEDRMYEERRQETLKMIEQHREQELAPDGDEIPESVIESINTDDEDEEIAYEKWLIREQARLQRDRQLRCKDE